MLITGIDGKVKGCLVVSHVMEGLIFFSQLTEDMLGLFWRWLRDVYLLETAHEPLRTGEMTVILLVGCGTYETDAA